MATINSKIEGVDVLGVVTAGETIYVGRATSTQHGIVKPAATDFEFDNQTNAMLIKLGVGLKRTDGGIAIAIYDGNVVTDVTAEEDGLKITYTDVDEETSTSKVIPWSEFTAAEIEYLKKYFNIEPGTGEGAVQQIGAKATGPHSAAFGGKRYDKPDSASWIITEAKGGDAIAAGGSVLADADFDAAFGKGTEVYQKAGFGANTGNQVGMTEDEFNAYYWDSAKNVPLHGGGGKDKDGNILSEFSSTYADSYSAAAVFGDGNKDRGYGDIMSGSGNDAEGSGNATSGQNHKVHGKNLLTGGQGNKVGQNKEDVGNALTFGQFLINNRWNKVVFGEYNDEELDDNGNPVNVFEFGAGTAQKRDNIMRLRYDGRFIIGKLGKINKRTRFQVSNGNSESDRRALIDSRNNGVTHIESYMSTLNATAGNGNEVAESDAAAEAGIYKKIADVEEGNFPLINTALFGEGLRNPHRFNQTVVGQYNQPDKLALFQVGSGQKNSDGTITRKLGFRVDWNGRAKSDTAAAGDEFYVRVADLGENIVFPFGEHSVDYDATTTGEGLTITGNLRIYVKKGATDADSIFHDIPDAKISIPIKAGNGISIDKADGEEWIVVKAEGGGGVTEPLVLTAATAPAIQIDRDNGATWPSIYVDVYPTVSGTQQGIHVVHSVGNFGVRIGASSIRYTESTGNEYIFLHQGNVKTLFGNQSLYGSGNIDLYRHNVQIDYSGGLAYFTWISSSNTVIDSLTDLYTALNGATVSATGYHRIDSQSYWIYSIQGSSGGGITCASDTSDYRLISWASLTNVVITDTVTTL